MWLFRALARSWKAVSTIVPHWSPAVFQFAPFLGAKSLLRRERLRSGFQSKPVYWVPATAVFSEDSFSWVMIATLKSFEEFPLVENKPFQLVWSQMWLLSKVMLGPFTPTPHPLPILTSKGPLLHRHDPTLHCGNTHCCICLLRQLQQTIGLRKDCVS